MPIKVDIVLFFQWKIFFFFLHFSFCSNIQMLFSVCSVHGLVCVCARHSSWETGVKLQDWDLSKNITMSRLWNTSWKKHYKWVSFLMDDHLNDCVWHSGASGGLEDAKGCDIQTVVTGSNFAKWRTHCSNTRSSLGWLHLFLFLTSEIMALKTQKYVSWNKLNSDYDPFLFTVCVILFLFSDWVN